MLSLTFLKFGCQIFMKSSSSPHVLTMDSAYNDSGVPFYGTSAYVQAFDDTIAFALEKNGNLWNTHESAQLRSCRPESLHEGARLLLSRLSLRKAKWMKSSSVSHYVLYKGRNLTNTSDTDGGLLRSLETLKQFSFLEILQTNSSFELAFEAVQSCFLLDDLTRLYKRLTSSKSTNSNNKSMSKEELLSAIHHAVRTQRTLFGHSLSHKFAPAVLEVVKEASAGSFWTNRNNADTNNTYARTPNRSNKADPNMVILRINPEILHLLRRCQRLYQISCNAGSSGYSNTTTASSTGINYNATGAAAANNTSAATTGFASVLTPLEFNAPLLEIFNKTRYPDYNQQCLCLQQQPFNDRSSSANVNDASISVTSRDSNTIEIRNEQRSNVFQSQRSFLQWEGAVELHAACLDQGIQELLLNGRGQDKLHILIESFQSDTFLNMLHPNKDTSHRSLYALARQCGLTQVFSPAPGENSAVLCDPRTETTNTNISEPTDVISKTGKKPIAAKSRASNTTIDISCLSSAHLLAVLCMLSYAYKHTGDIPDQHTDFICMDGEDSGGAFADHMLKFDAGTQLAYACSDAATAAEKEPYRQYTFAILLFELLLELPYLPHRRGYWYKRLCIDYAHLQLHRCALRACYRCLGDSCVNVSDKTDLASRATALKLKITKQHAAADVAAKKSNGRNNSAVIVKDEIEESVNMKSEDEWSVFAVERDFPTALASSTNLTKPVATSFVGDSDEANQELAVKSGRKSRSKRTRTEQNTSATSTSCEAINTGDEIIEGTALSVLCLINILPVNSSVADPAAAHSVLGVLYNTLLREIVHSPHATSAVVTDPTLIEEYKAVTKVETPAISPTTSGFALTIQEQLSSEVGKRKLPNTTTTLTSSSKLSKSHSVSSAGAIKNSITAWACTVCTFLNTTERFCSMCMTARVATALKSTSTSSSARKPIRSSTTSGISVFTKATSTVSKTNSSSSKVVDLVSDDDEVEIVDIITPAKIHVPTACERPVTQINADSTREAPTATTTVTKQFSTEATVVAKHSLATGFVNTEVAKLKPRLDSIYVNMLQYLRSLMAMRRTTCSKFSSDTENDTLSYELNLNEINGEGEEEDDLLLLGLLPDITQYKTEYQDSVASSLNCRPSLEDLIPAPPFFVVTGKRTGDPANRKGKSKFCGLNDELVNVETYVMQKCHIIDTDDCPEEVTLSSIDNIREGCVKAELPVMEVKEELMEDVPASARNRRSSNKKTQPIPDTVSTTTENDNAIEPVKCATSTSDKKEARRVPYPLAIDNGGWQGWHCEGYIFKTLFGLLMWDVLFACPVCSENSGCSANKSSSSAGSASTIASTYCVFVTPFQDAPLDLGHRSFYRTRGVAIQKRIAQIASFSTQQLIAELGGVYRKHYGENCRGVHWGVSLPLLQLMAVCMGSTTVAAVCNALCVNYKHFTGGAPDLMLVRVQRRIVRTDTVIFDGNNSGDTGAMKDSISLSAASTYPVTDYDIVPVQEILGQDWETQLNQPVVLPRRRSVANSNGQENNYESVLVQADNDGAEGYADEMMDVEEECVEDSFGELDSSTMETDGNTDIVNSPVSKGIHTEASNVEEPNAHFRDLFLPHLAPTPDVARTDTERATNSSSNAQGADIPQTLSSYTYEYKLEARFVEVKGPTDSLMFRQRVWLHILNSAVVKGDNIGVPNYNAYVCHVKEE